MNYFSIIRAFIPTLQRISFVAHLPSDLNRDYFPDMSADVFDVRLANRPYAMRIAVIHSASNWGVPDRDELFVENETGQLITGYLKVPPKNAVVGSMNRQMVDHGTYYCVATLG